ncbi:hypothetical protein [Lysobacter gummosus]
MASKSATIGSWRLRHSPGTEAGRGYSAIFDRFREQGCFCGRGFSPDASLSDRQNSPVRKEKHRG